MPNNLALGSFVLGSFLLILAIVGGGFELFGAKVTRTISSPSLRILSGILGIVFILVAFMDPSNIFNPRPTAIPDQPTVQPDPSQGCVVNIIHPFINIKSEPSIQSEDVGRASLGKHAVLDHARTEFAGQQQLWYRIDNKGQRGWVLFLAFTMEKEGDCP